MFILHSGLRSKTSQHERTGFVKDITMSMVSLYPRIQAAPVVSDDGGGDVEVVHGYRVLYGIAVACFSIFLFCVFAASFTVWKALAFAALAALLLGVAGCLAPKTWFRRRSTSSTELVVTVTTTAAAARPPAPGYAAMALVNAPPAFAFECPVTVKDGASDEPAAASSCCAVCLEDVRGGETVRQVPACRHVFHVECIDMWLHSHRTCPMCRCMVSPPPVASPDKAAAEEASAEQLPPV